MKPLVYRKQDYMGYGVLVAYLVAAVLIGGCFCNGDDGNTKKAPHLSGGGI